VIVELKAIANFDPAHSKQVLTYLKVTGLHVALLLNFGVATLGTQGIKRFQL
jgi:GxxExxY protein